MTVSELLLRVSNDGEQFPAAKRESPFEPTVGGEGHGLGLWASHQLVTSMGGRITLSMSGDETTLEVCLPLHRAALTSAAPEVVA